MQIQHINRRERKRQKEISLLFATMRKEEVCQKFEMDQRSFRRMSLLMREIGFSKNYNERNMIIIEIELLVQNQITQKKKPLKCWLTKKKMWKHRKTSRAFWYFPKKNFLKDRQIKIYDTKYIII